MVEDPRVGKSNVATVDRIVAESTIGPRSRCHGEFDHSKRTRSSVNDTYRRMGSRRNEQVIVTSQRDDDQNIRTRTRRQFGLGIHKVNKSDLPRIRDMSVSCASSSRSFSVIAYKLGVGAAGVMSMSTTSKSTRRNMTSMRNE